MEATLASSSPPTPRVEPGPAPLSYWPIYAVVCAATSIVIGVEWDISWHKTIGRDTFWTPAHMAIYLGGIVAGLSCGWVVLRTTFAGTAAQKAACVRFWGFHGPLGAWSCIWGAIAMITSAPFDDWWHNAYGLDVEILSPPHTVLALGIGAIVVGAVLMTLAAQNRSEAEVAVGAEEEASNGDTVGEHLPSHRSGTRVAVGAAAEGRARALARSRALFAYAAGLLVLVIAIMTTEFSFRIYMHSAIFYQVVCGVFPFCILSAGRASRLRWPATTVVGVYTVIRLLMIWILPLFPAEPRLGPIFQDVTHMVPPDFPLLLAVPAVFLDLALQRFGTTRRRWLLAAALGGIFLVTFLVVQWPFAEFLLSPASRNRFFATDNFFYGLPPDAYTVRGEFYPSDRTPAALRNGLLIALGLAAVSARAGLWWGDWMARVRR
ncbi:MAG TPA: hypothetical protein VF188_07625 [Longimicrobiales bacterium]